MKLDTIGKNIRKFRLARKLRQEDLAEKTDLTTNYIGMVERGEENSVTRNFHKDSKCFRCIIGYGSYRCSGNGIYSQELNAE